MNRRKKAKKNGVEHFIYLSSIAVYGDDKTVIRWDTETQPNTNYGMSKLKAENLLHTLIDIDFKVSIIRPPMVYDNNAPGYINKLVKSINLFPIYPLGNIDKMRSLIYVKILTYISNKIVRIERGGLFLVVMMIKLAHLI
jgi:UDP-glucose 4-epimerase